MKRTIFFIPLIGLALSACETDRPYRGDYPPGEMQPGRPTPPPLQGAPVTPPPSSRVETRPIQPVDPPKQQNLGGFMDALEKELRAGLRGSTWLIARRGDEIFIGAQNSQLFTEGGDVALPAEGWLGRLSQILRRFDRTRLEIGGFTDTTGANDKNIELSGMRARKIAGSLSAAGVAASRIRTVGYGETRLKIHTVDEANEPRNRRIEIRVTAAPGS